MGKVDIEFSAECSQSSIGRIKQGVCGAIIHRPEPFSLKDSPQCLCNIQMRTVWRKKEEKQTALLPYRAKFPHKFTSVHTRIVKYNKRVLTDAERKPVKKIGNFVGSHVLCGRKSLISVIAIYHAENVESQSPFGRSIDILTSELPSIWHVSLGTDVAFIHIIKIDETLFFLLYEFLQLLGLIHIELRRGFPLRTFSYTSISRAKADKKARKVLSLASFPEARCHASFASFTLCLSFSMALRAVHDRFANTARTCLQASDAF